MLSESLETVGGERKVTAGDKKDLAGQIERLKQQVKQLTQARDAADAEVIKLKADHAEVPYPMHSSAWLPSCDCHSRPSPPGGRRPSGKSWFEMGS